MPTFKNNTNKYIDYVAKIHDAKNGLLVRFSPGEEKQLSFWLPFQNLGLTLVDANFPPTPQTILASGTYVLTSGAERIFHIERCDAYTLDVIAQEGRVSLYIGQSQPVDICHDTPVAYRYRGNLDWELAPVVTVINNTTEIARFTIAAERYVGLARGCP